MTLRWHMVINFGVQSPLIRNFFKKWNFDIAAAVPDNNFSVQSFVLSDSSPMRIGFWHWRSTSGYKISTQWFLSNEHWILTVWWRVAAGCEPPQAHLCSQLSWHGICTHVLDWHLYSRAWLAFVLLYSTWIGNVHLCTGLRIVLMYSSGVSYVLVQNREDHSDMCPGDKTFQPDRISSGL